MTPDPPLRILPDQGGPASRSGYVDVRGAAELLATTPKGIYSLVHRREIPYRKLGRKVLFDPMELRAWVDRNKVEPLS